MGPCGPGGDYMREGHSMTHCTYCGEGYTYGTSCSCKASREAREASKTQSNKTTTVINKLKKKLRKKI